VRQTGCQTRDRLSWVDRSRLNLSVHLDGAESKILSEGVTGRNELGALLDDGSSSGLVRLVHDESEVLGSKEGRNGFLDAVETLPEPSNGSGEVGEG
jgi:hypothetical protein